jgi:hypothetical protein
MEGERQTRLVRFVKEMIDAIGVEERRPTLDAVDGIACAEQEFGKVRTVLPSDPGDQCDPGHPRPSVGSAAVAARFASVF